MRITWNELTVELDKIRTAGLLAEWQWLMPGPMEIVMVSSLGDAFLEDTSGAVYWLDTGAAKITQIAGSVGDFHNLRQLPENANTWFAAQLVGDLLQQGMVLGSSQVFSYRLAPTLNGQFEPDNFEPADALVHFTFLGSIQRQVKGLPDGTVINRFEVES